MINVTCNFPKLEARVVGRPTTTNGNDIGVFHVSYHLSHLFGHTIVYALSHHHGLSTTATIGAIKDVTSEDKIS